MVVVLIIGILASVALPQYTKSVEKAGAAEALIIVKAIASAQDRYFLENGEYSNDLDELDIEITGDKSNFGPEFGKNRKATQFFDYGARNTDIAIKAVANRLPISTKYYISVQPDNTIRCTTYNSSYKQICAALGGKLVSSSNCSSCVYTLSY